MMNTEHRNMDGLFYDHYKQKDSTGTLVPEMGYFSSYLSHVWNKYAPGILSPYFQ